MSVVNMTVNVNMNVIENVNIDKDVEGGGAIYSVTCGMRKYTGKIKKMTY